MAEVIFTSLSEDRHEAFSAGTQVCENEGQRIVDRPSAAHVIAVLDEIGLDVRGKTRTQLTEKMVDDADIVISMAEHDTLPNYINDSPKTFYWNLIDPFEQSLEFTRDTRNQIEKLVRKLLVDLD